MSDMLDTNQNKPADSIPGSSHIKSSLFSDLLLLALRPKSISPESATAAWIRRHQVLALVGLAYGLTLMA